MIADKDSNREEGLSVSFTGDEPLDIPIQQVEASPCHVACPAGVNVKSYVSLIAAGRFKDALEVVRETNPLPGICGRICTHPCEMSCNRGDVDQPLAIRELKRFISDWELEHLEESRPQPAERTHPEKVAIIGAGPAGLTAANDLVRMGYGVTIFEALDRPGGMMVGGIPPFRLPRNVIETEIQSILDLGVELKLETPLGPDLTVDDLMTKHGYKAVFLAVGAWKGRKLGIPGEETGLDAVAFLKAANLESAEKPGDKIVVVGGGNSAIDSARMSLRLGSDEVRIVYRRTREEMPADEGEIEEALDEGIGLDYLASPIEVVVENGKVTGMKVIRNELGEPDASGRRRPVPIEDSEYVIPCDRVIAAISQAPDLEFLPANSEFKLTRWNTFEAAEDTLATNVEGVFAGGDAFSGPASVIDAMRDGHKVATAIHCYLRDEPLPEPEAGPARPGDQELPLSWNDVEKQERAHAGHADPTHRRRSFDEVANAFTEEDAVREANRCMHCGPCSECLICISSCDRKLFVTEDEEGKEVFLRIPSESEAYERATTNLDAMLKGDAAEKGKLEPVTSYVLEELCRGCGECSSVCEYDVAKLIERDDGRLVSVIDQELCRGCGVCAAICPSNAIVARHFTDEWVEAKLKDALLG